MIDWLIDARVDQLMHWRLVWRISLARWSIWERERDRVYLGLRRKSMERRSMLRRCWWWCSSIIGLESLETHGNIEREVRRVIGNFCGVGFIEPWALGGRQDQRWRRRWSFASYRRWRRWYFLSIVDDRLGLRTARFIIFGFGWDVVRWVDGMNELERVNEWVSESRYFDSIICRSIESISRYLSMRSIGWMTYRPDDGVLIIEDHNRRVDQIDIDIVLGLLYRRWWWWWWWCIGSEGERRMTRDTTNSPEIPRSHVKIRKNQNIYRSTRFQQ